MFYCEVLKQSLLSQSIVLSQKMLASLPAHSLGPFCFENRILSIFEQTQKFRAENPFLLMDRRQTQKRSRPFSTQQQQWHPSYTTFEAPIQKQNLFSIMRKTSNLKCFLGRRIFGGDNSCKRQTAAAETRRK